MKVNQIVMEESDSLFLVEVHVSNIKFEHYERNLEDAIKIFDKSVQTNIFDTVVLSKCYKYKSPVNNKNYGEWLRLNEWRK